MTLSECGHRRGGLILTLLVGVAIVTAAPRWAWCRPGDDWVGKRVTTKLGARLRTEPALVDNEKRDADAVSDLRNAGRIFRVERVNGPWLWIQDGKNSAAGWVTADWLVARDEAADYFTSVILADPSSVAAYLGRGRIREDTNESDLALADFDAVIRLDPKVAIAYDNRGKVWFGKKAYDKAIADYTKAIQLDPKLTAAYTNRGWTWYEKKQYDNAIADFDEAIRLDPGNAGDDNHLGLIWSAPL